MRLADTNAISEPEKNPLSNTMMIIMAISINGIYKPLSTSIIGESMRRSNADLTRQWVLLHAHEGWPLAPLLQQIHLIS